MPAERPRLGKHGLAVPDGTDPRLCVAHARVVALWKQRPCSGDPARHSFFFFFFSFCARDAGEISLGRVEKNRSIRVCVCAQRLTPDACPVRIQPVTTHGDWHLSARAIGLAKVAITGTVRGAPPRIKIKTFRFVFLSHPGPSLAAPRPALRTSPVPDRPLLLARPPAMMLSSSGARPLIPAGRRPLSLLPRTTTTTTWEAGQEGVGHDIAGRSALRPVPLGRCPSGEAEAEAEAEAERDGWQNRAARSRTTLRDRREDRRERAAELAASVGADAAGTRADSWETRVASAAARLIFFFFFFQQASFRRRRAARQPRGTWRGRGRVWGMSFACRACGTDTTTTGLCGSRRPWAWWERRGRGGRPPGRDDTLAALGLLVGHVRPPPRWSFGMCRCCCPAGRVVSGQ